MNLILAARRTEPMERLAEQLRQKYRVHVVVEGLDLSLAGAGVALKSRLDQRGIAVDVLVNNAGCGLYGSFVDQPLQTMLGKMKVGDVSDVIRTQRGYQILGLESRTETKVKSFDEARQDISDKIADEKRRGETQKYLEKLRGTATITWHNDELKKAYEQALADRQKPLESEQSATAKN